MVPCSCCSSSPMPAMAVRAVSVAPALFLMSVDILVIAADDLDRARRLIKARRSFDAVPIRLQLSEEELARFAVHRPDFPGVDQPPAGLDPGPEDRVGRAAHEEAPLAGQFQGGNRILAHDRQRLLHIDMLACLQGHPVELGMGGGYR